MIDLNRPKRKSAEPTGEQIAMLILCIALWTAFLLGVMMSC